MYKTYLLMALCGALLCSIAYAATCTDSDNGADIYTKGTMTVGTKVYVDGCDKSGSVKEFTCISTRSTAYHCPKGCSNGACIREVITTPDFFLASADVQYLSNPSSTNALGLTFQRLTAIVRNDGTGAGSVVLTYAYTTFSSVTNTQSVVEKTFTTPSINAGASYTAILDITDAGDNAICAGPLSVYVDKNNLVAEVNENNNNMVLAVPCPDFAVENYAITPDYGYGVDATFTIKNVGTVAAAPRNFWLTGYDAAGVYGVILYETGITTILAPMQTMTISRHIAQDRCAFPNKATRILVEAESIGSGSTIVSAVDEPNASNNVAFRNTICSLPDFTLIAMDPVYSSGFFDLTVQISNRGTGTPAMSGVTRVLDGQGYEVARFDPVTLTAGQNANLFVRIPAVCGTLTAEILPARDGRREMSSNNNAMSVLADCPSSGNSTNSTG